MSLRTLKNCVWNCNDKEQLVDDLKKEAIKWIKEIERVKEWEEINNYDWELRFIANRTEEGRVYMVWLLKHFFNITEEDLK